MTPFDRKEAEIEIGYCIASIRQLIAVSDDAFIADRIASALPAIRREADAKYIALRNNARMQVMQNDVEINAKIV